MNLKRYKAVFLDRDGVINREHGHVTSIDGFEILTGVPEAIKMLNDHGILTIIVSNQSGIARGLLTIEKLETIHDYLRSELHKHGAKIDEIYYSPWHPDKSLKNGVEQWLGDHEDRKPGTGMIDKAMRKYQLSPDQVCLVGDSGRDQQAAKKAGIDFYGVRSAKYQELDQSSCELFDSLLDVVNHMNIS